MNCKSIRKWPRRHYHLSKDEEVKNVGSALLIMKSLIRQHVLQRKFQVKVGPTIAILMWYSLDSYLERRKSFFLASDVEENGQPVGLASGKPQQAY